MKPLLEIEGLHKAYAAPVLIDIDLTVYAGEVHALVGANGAGKSTLSRIISGLTGPDSGTMRLSGEGYLPKAKSEAEGAGVQMVMQELNLIPTLSIAENLFLNRMPHRFGFVDFPGLDRRARAALEAVGLDNVDPSTPVSHLGVGRQQLVEIASALARPCRLLILDEPTAALTDPETDLLFEQIHRLKSEGVGIIYISHRMDEIRRIADRVSVLRDGRVVRTAAVLEVTTEEIVRLMVGRETVETVGAGGRIAGKVALRVRGLRSADLVQDVDLELHRGEILGLAGLVGSGRTELLRAVFGAEDLSGGGIEVEGREARIRHPRDAVRAGIGMVPEDRKLHGLLLSQSIRVNTTLARLGAVTRPRWWLDRRRERAVAEGVRERLSVESASVEQPALELSGGNQQKVVIGRWLFRDCDILLFDEPTRGIDIGAKQTVYGVLRDLASRDKAILMVSSELLELMAICDRIAVMSAGRLTATFSRGEWSEEKIMAAAFSNYVGVRGSKEIGN